MSNGLIKNTFIYGLGNFGSKFISFFIVPIYTFFLSNAELGYYDLILTTVSLFIPVITFQLSDAIFRWLLDGKESKTFYSIVITTVFLFTTIVIFLLVGIWFFVGFIFDYEYTMMIGLLLISNAYYVLLQQTIRGLRLNKLFALSGVIFSFLLLILNLLFLYVLNLKIQGLLISNIIAFFVVNCLMLYYSRIYEILKKDNFSFKELKKYLKYSIPLIPNTISWWLITLANRYIIVYFLGTSANGIYAVANKFPTLLFMINSFFILAWQEEAILMESKPDKSKYYNQIFLKYSILLFSLVIVLISFTKVLFEFIISENFYTGWKYVSILYISAAIQSLSMFFGAGYLTKKNTSGVFISTFIGAIFTIIFSLLLTNSLELYGMAIGTLIGVTVTFLIRVYQMRFDIKINYQQFPFFIILIGIASAIFLQYTDFDYLAWIISLSILFWLNKEIVLSYKDKIMQKIKTFDSSINK